MRFKRYIEFSKRCADARFNAPWVITPDARKAKLLYVGMGGFDFGGNIEIFSVPKYLLVGQITDGIDGPEGIATDSRGNLSVANLYSGTVTVYPLGKSTRSLTLKVPTYPNDVAVEKNGYVLVGDQDGAVDVYPPGKIAQLVANEPETRSRERPCRRC